MHDSNLSVEAEGFENNVNGRTVLKQEGDSRFIARCIGLMRSRHIKQYEADFNGIIVKRPSDCEGSDYLRLCGQNSLE